MRLIRPGHCGSKKGYRHKGSKPGTGKKFQAKPTVGMAMVQVLEFQRYKRLQRFKRKYGFNFNKDWKFLRRMEKWFKQREEMYVPSEG